MLDRDHSEFVSSAAEGKGVMIWVRQEEQQEEEEEEERD